MAIMTTAPSAARERLLQTASEIFYREGIHGIGVDRILADAGVTRATMYRHFAGKEALVVAYLNGEDERLKAAFAAASDGRELTPGEMLVAVVHGIADDVATRHTRGCPFINAAAEYPHADSPVRAVISEHRAWFRGTLGRIVADAGVPEPERAANALVLLRDAALVGGYLDGAERVRESFLHTAGAVLGREV